MTEPTYTIERINYMTDEVKKFCELQAPKIAEMFDNSFDYKNCPIELFPQIPNCLFLVARRNGHVRGIMVAFLQRSVLDTQKKILRQQLFYVKPDSGRTAYHLFEKFIDIGKREANHIITMLTSQTNIKSSTLERWGFGKLETLYRMEVGNE